MTDNLFHTNDMENGEMTSPTLNSSTSAETSQKIRSNIQNMIDREEVEPPPAPSPPQKTEAFHLKSKFDSLIISAKKFQPNFYLGLFLLLVVFQIFFNFNFESVFF